MATKTWIATGTTPTSWSTAANWSGAAIPATGDDVIFDSTGLAPVLGGDHTVAGGVSNALHSLVVYPSYTSDIGSSGSPLAVDINNGTLPFFHYQGTGNLYFNKAPTNVPTVSKFICETAATATASVNIGGTFTEAIFIQGKISVYTSATITTGTVNFKLGQQTDVTMSIGTSCTLTTFNQLGGSVTSQSAPVTLNIDAGLFYLTGTGNITTLSGKGGGAFYWQATSSGNTITTLTLDGNFTFDGTAIRAAQTLTTVNIRSEAALLDLRSGAKIAAATINPYVQNPKIRLDVGRKISLA